MTRYGYQDIEDGVTRAGGSLRPPARIERAKCQDRTRAGRLAYWTEEARKDLESRSYWALSESLAKLSGALEENGQDGRPAMWSAVVVWLQCDLLFKAERVGEWIELWAEDQPGRTAFDEWTSRGAFAVDAPAWRGRLDRLGDAPADVLPGIGELCVLASPEECRAGLAGSEEVSRRVLQRLISRRRASCSPRGGRGRWPSPRCARP